MIYILIKMQVRILHIRDAYGHNVKVILTNGDELKGRVIDYENPLETDTGNYDMDLKTNLCTYSIDESDIKQIEIIEK